jgi:DNA modification methylase
VKRPYYDHGGIQIYHGDCRDVLPNIVADVLVMDPPYGIDYASGMTGHHGGTALPGIAGDADTSLRDAVLAWWGDRPALVFGTWKRPRPVGCRAVLVWDKGEHVGMGDLSLPWKPNTEEVYVLGRGFAGHRGGSVLRSVAAVTWNSVGHGRYHPHEKPVPLMRELIVKCPSGLVVDPFAGSGSTLRAAKDAGRRAIGIEIEERYCEIAAKRLAQEALLLEVA